MRKWICLLLIAFELGCVIPQISVAENSGEYGYSYNEEWVDLDNPNHTIFAICTLIDGKTPAWR